MKRNVVQNAASSSGNYEEEPTSEAITKKQRKTRSDKKYKNEEEKREACKEINRKRYAKRIGVVNSTCERKKQPETLPRISCHAVPHLDEVTAVYCCPTARHIEKISNTNALERVTLDGNFFEDFVEEKNGVSSKFWLRSTLSTQSELDKTNGLGSGSLSES